MHTLILIVHIFSMSASLALIITALILGFLGKHSAMPMATTAAISTVVGGSSGTILLLTSPLSFQCVTLTLYLIAFGLVYKFAFGFGKLQNSRLLQNR